MPKKVSVVNEPKSIKTPKYKNSRETLKSEKQNHQNIVSTLDRGWKRCYLTQAAHEMHLCGDKVHCG